MSIDLIAWKSRLQNKYLLTAILTWLICSNGFADGIGVYSQLGKGAAFLPIKYDSKSSDTAFYDHYQAGLLYDLDVVAEISHFHRFAVGYEKNIRRYEDNYQNRFGYAVSYAYLIRVQRRPNTWFGPAVSVVVYDSKYELDFASATDSYSLGLGVMMGMNQAIRKWTVSYSLELSNPYDLFADTDVPGKEGRIISLQGNVALIYNLEK